MAPAALLNVVEVSKPLTPAQASAAAVMAFEGTKGAVFSDLVAHQLLQRGVMLVERTRLAAVLGERALTLDDLVAGGVNPSVAAEVAQVDTLVFGSVIPITVHASGVESGVVLAASVRLVDVRSGQVLSSVSFNSNTEILAKGMTYGTAAAMMIGKLIRKKTPIRS